RGDSLYDIESSNPSPFLNLEQWQVINTTTWHASDAITIKNIMSYGEFRERANFDLYTSNWRVPNVFGAGGFNVRLISPLLPPTVVPAGTPYKMIVLDVEDGRHTSAQSTFTEELQLQGTAVGGKLNYVVGGYLEFSRPIGFSAGRTGIFLDCTRPSLPATCANPLFIGNVSDSRTQYKFDNHGIFAQGTYRFTDKLALTLGGRWTFDKIVGIDESTRIGILRFLTPAQSAALGGTIPAGLRGPDGTLRCRDVFRKPD